LEGFEVVRLKLNGTFGRNLELLDPSGNVYIVMFRIQTALWEDSTGEQYYVSVFPNFIRKFTRPCLSVLEYISCNIGKGEDIFSHIDDRNNIHSCEDRMAHLLEALDKKCAEKNYTVVINARYTPAFNRSITIPTKEVSRKRFPHLFTLILVAREYFCVHWGSLAAAWSVFRF
jgi:hypothetical protein